MTEIDKSRQTLSSTFGVRKDVGWLGKYWHNDGNATRRTRSLGEGGMLLWRQAVWIDARPNGESEFHLSRLTMPANICQVFF